MPTVAIVEDDKNVRAHLVELLQGVPGYECVGVWGDAESALAELPQKLPDIVLMDIHLPGISGIECVAELKAKAQSVHVLMMRVYEDSEKIFHALSAGAGGYLVKCDIPRKLIPALKELLSGGAPMSSHIARRVVSYFQKKASAPADKTALTPREREVLALLAHGR